MEHTGKSTRLLIADDHELFRDALRKLLTAQPGLEVVGAAADGEEAVRLVRQLQPDILLLDMAMPRFSGIVTLRDLANSQTAIHIILLAAEIEIVDMIEALQLGARAVVLKEWEPRELFASIHAVMAGGYWVEHESVAGLEQALRKVQGIGRRPLRDFGLTQRELEIVELVAAAYPNRDIAERFSIAADTVKRHLTHIFEKLDVSSRLELVRFAIDHRLAGRSFELAAPPGK